MSRSVLERDCLEAGLSIIEIGSSEWARDKWQDVLLDPNEHTRICARRRAWWRKNHPFTRRCACGRLVSRGDATTCDKRACKARQKSANARAKRDAERSSRLCEHCREVPPVKGGWLCAPCRKQSTRKAQREYATRKRNAKKLERRAA